jgi:serine/threonine protein kinase/tetratricopeptide (TPR) repeat protein
MSDCPEECELLRFLDGELDATDDSRVLAHIEGCTACHERLERLTEAGTALGEVALIETARTDLDAAANMPAPDHAACDESYRQETGEPIRPQPGNPLEPGPEARAAEDREDTADIAASGDGCAPGNQERKRDEDDPYRTEPQAGEPEDVVGARAEPRPDWPNIPGYEILERLGKGGMGVVYKARHHGLNRLVALKMIVGGAHASAERLARFRIEAEAVARLQHPNILQIYDIGEVGGLPFVALELLEGGSLDHRLAGDPQAGRGAADLLITLAGAVQVAHKAGIVHRDLKPANVLYTSDSVPKITDFGLAKRIDSDAGQTESGQIMGSPSYMAPEQARGHSRAVGPAADVYALGAILYQMLTGRPPFKGETPIETARQVVDDDPVPPSRLVPRVERDLETICLKCLHKEPSRRYESAQALVDDLGRFLRREPIRARRTPAWERGAKWARRRPVAAAASAFGVVAIVSVIAASFIHQRNSYLWSLQREQEGNRLSDQARKAKGRDELARMAANLANFLKTIPPETGLGELRWRMRAELELVQNRVEDLAAQETERAQVQSERLRMLTEREQIRRFGDLRIAVLFHDTQFSGLELADNQEAIRRNSRAALELFAAPGSGGSWELGPLPSSFSTAERAEIVEGCYELLLILAAAERTPDQGLRRLDQAARLRLPTTAYHLRREACLIAAGRLPAAAEERHRAQALQPKTGFDHFLIGREDYRRGDARSALKHFNRAIQLQPDHFWAQCLSALCLLQSHEPIQAGARLNACLQRERDSAWLYLLRGFASNEVAATFLSLAARSADREERFRDQVSFQFEAAESDYIRAQELLERKPNNELQYALLVNRGVLGLQRRDFDKAAEYLKAAIRLDGRQYPAYAALAHVYQERHSRHAALEQFRRAIALRPGLASLYRDRAEVELQREHLTPAQRARALSDLEQAIRLEHPGDRMLARDHTRRARILVLDHREAEALAACDAALKISPGDEKALRLRIDLLLAAKRHDEVIRSCDALMAGGKASATVAELRGLARAARRDYIGAIEDATIALSLSPEQARLLAWRGWLHLLTDGSRLALRDFEAVIQLDSSSADAYIGRGSARVRIGQHREGSADAEKALSLGLGDPGPRLFYNVARIYAMAAAVAGTEARKSGQEAVALVARYQDRAVILLQEAWKRTPDAERASFWRESIEADPALGALRRRLRFDGLVASNKHSSS